MTRRYTVYWRPAHEQNILLRSNSLDRAAAEARQYARRNPADSYEVWDREQPSMPIYIVRWEHCGESRCECGRMTLRRAKARGKSREHKPGCSFYTDYKQSRVYMREL